MGGCSLDMGLFVTVCVVAYNEEKTIMGILNEIAAQDYPHQDMEILLIDSNSTDNTKHLLESFQRNTSGFRRIEVLDNPRRILSAGWNVALKHYQGDAIVRVDAHADIPKDFITRNVRMLNQGEYITGGIRPNVVDEPDDWKNTILLAEQSMFGSSIAPYRRSEKKRYVKSIFHGCYRREVFDKVGNYNENLGRTEDNEMNHRIRQAGFKLCYSPDIISYQHTRTSLRKMMKQKFGNGYWVALTLKVSPKCLSWYHFVPLMFIIGIILTISLGVMGVWWPFVCFFGLYFFSTVVCSFLAVRGVKKVAYQFLLPIIFFCLHVSYGIGSVIGIIKLPFWNGNKR